jgi:hypothetical protein
MQSLGVFNCRAPESWLIGSTTEEEQGSNITTKLVSSTVLIVIVFARTLLVPKKESKSMKTGETKFNTKEMVKLGLVSCYE